MESLLNRVVKAMQRIAPLRLADRSWDNVGTLIEAPFPRADANGVMLTIDLTPQVVEECRANPNVGVIIAYHPPIFKGMKRLTLNEPKENIVLTCVALGISVYSPHTALDNCRDGINDCHGSGFDHGTTTFIQPFSSYQPEDEGLGTGRIKTLDHPVALGTLVQQVKALLKLEHVRLAKGTKSIHDTMTSIAVCAGSGASVLRDAKADVYLTGEMSHHEVLAANAAGVAVILCDHTNTERGYLSHILVPRLQSQFEASKWTDIQLYVSQVDRDPLEIV